MNINFGGLKQDYSFLFSGLNSSRNSSNNLLTSINLSDYNSIKTGTYGKLLKAYYKKDDVDTKDTSSKKNNTTVNKVDETTVTIKFNIGEKTLSSIWVSEKCKII